jgi:hypothetical protein
MRDTHGIDRMLIIASHNSREYPLDVKRYLRRTWFAIKKSYKIQAIAGMYQGYLISGKLFNDGFLKECFLFMINELHL